MATNKLSILLLVAIVTALATSGSAKEFIVGDGKGWTLNVDYQAWANGKEFVVGDKLVFTYPMGMHSVIRVDEAAFQQCSIPAANEALTSGNDVITLDTLGKKWFICGVGKHCQGGMKLSVDVIPQPTSHGVSSSSAPSSSPSAPGKDIMVGDDKGWIFGSDYQAWAKGKEFHVGDKLVFKYPKGHHNVVEVDAAAFQQCIVPAASTAPINIGYDLITLTTPGDKWYICGVGKHCEMGGMKLSVKVLPQLTSDDVSSSSAPSPSSSASGKDIMVGDEKGWIFGSDYQAWVKGKEFHVGDKLVFKYPKGHHNVVEVDAAAFQKCIVPAACTAPSSTGYDVITLTTPGDKWYICGVGKHCEMGGMKLSINVLPQLPSASPLYNTVRRMGSVIKNHRLLQGFHG